jgi:hypothetical protein
LALGNDKLGYRDGFMDQLFKRIGEWLFLLSRFFWFWVFANARQTLSVQVLAWERGLLG